jgi:hypothetical protein
VVRLFTRDVALLTCAGVGTTTTSFIELKEGLSAILNILDRLDRLPSVLMPIRFSSFTKSFIMLVYNGRVV